MKRFSVFLFLVVGLSQMALARSLLLFNQGALTDSAQRRVLVLPNSQLVSVNSLQSLCPVGQAAAVRSYDLETHSCDAIPYHAFASFNHPMLSEPLRGSVLAGQPVSDALDANYFVWFDTKTRFACVVGSCFNTFATSGNTDVVITAFSATPAEISQGSSTLLSWSADFATSCELSDNQGGVPQTVADVGSVSRSPSITTDYTLTCQGSNGPVSRDMIVAVNNHANILEFIATPSTIPSGASSVISWSTLNASVCALSENGGAPVGVAVNGSQSVSPATTAQYHLVCDGNGGSISKTLILTVTQDVHIVSFTAQPDSLSFAQSSVLSWQVTNASSCTIDNLLTGTQVSVDPLSPTGLRVLPSENTTYLLTCAGVNGPVTSSTEVMVDPGDGIFYSGMEYRPFLP